MAAAKNGHGDHHVMSLKVYFTIFAILIFFTALTVITAKLIDFGGTANAIIAFAIALTKALLVMGYFMHLKYDEKIYRYIIGSSFLFVILLFLICVLDLATRTLQQSTL
ncbi:MAG: cytochrome C oxidase subunit IV family protein [Bdellovibrionales bacterium]|nr:cytochrome C oxidase subunit IV family protein [Bdellovibrionales bacterium]